MPTMTSQCGRTGRGRGVPRHEGSRNHRAHMNSDVAGAGVCLVGDLAVISPGSTAGIIRQRRSGTQKRRGRGFFRVTTPTRSKRLILAQFVCRAEASPCRDPVQTDWCSCTVVNTFPERFVALGGG